MNLDKVLSDVDVIADSHSFDLGTNRSEFGTGMGAMVSEEYITKSFVLANFGFYSPCHS